LRLQAEGRKEAEGRRLKGKKKGQNGEKAKEIK
jgi:hypothetical protein